MSQIQSEVEPSRRAARMHDALTRTFRPIRLEIQNDSARHAGHSGSGEGGETHFIIEIVSDLFTSRTRLERSRMVHAALASEFDTGLHAITLNLHSPAE